MKISFWASPFDKIERDCWGFPKGSEWTKEDGSKVHMSFPWDFTITLYTGFENRQRRGINVRVWPFPIRAHKFNYYWDWPNGAKSVRMTATENIYLDANDNEIERRPREKDGNV